ncbi:MAG: Epimerase family protein [Anaerolineales bacterium]|nr:Epimerase family protein [Anaerolineales bacterium]
MNILIAGGTGFLGSTLADRLAADGHKIFILTRQKPSAPNHVQWDGVTTSGWTPIVNEVDAVINLTGLSTAHWPWTKKRKRQFVDSRVLPGRALASAIGSAIRRPRVFLQVSGINHYGLRGDSVADESTPPADDFLAQLTVQWEESTRPLEELGVRRVVLRSAVVLDKQRGLFPLMVLPVRLFFGGRFGNGLQAFPWIHIEDYARAARFLLEDENARGPFNLISPEPTSNAEFMRETCRALARPYWFHLPESLLSMTLGEMSVMLVDGRFARPNHLLEMGFKFNYGDLSGALKNLFA